LTKKHYSKIITIITILREITENQINQTVLRGPIGAIKLLGIV